MNRKLITLLFVLYSITVRSQALETFHDFSAVKINGDTLNLADLAGKKVLVVNTASLCSYTPQYADLEQLYLQYGDSTFTILGFPCNDFGGQEPGDETQIDSFCTNTYNVTFQMMKKISITATDTAEVYKWLQLQSRNGVADAPVLWNFQKFMIDEAGHWHDYKLTAVSPMDTSITNWIMSPSVLTVNENAPVVFDAFISPNPCQDISKIHISTNQKTKTTANLYSYDGRFVKKIFAGMIQQHNEIILSSDDLDSGIYFLKIETPQQAKTIKLCVVK